MSRLMYQIPSTPHKKVSLHIPESHTVYVCPNACARRHGLRALRNGLLENCSFLRFSQTDVISGGYEDSIVESCNHLLDVLPQHPRVLCLYVTCIDDFLATDRHYLIERLSCAHPDVHFTLSHINPIAEDLQSDKLQQVHCRLYEPLKAPAVHDNGITLIGHFIPIPEESEFYKLLSLLGLGPVRQLQDCADFAAYQDLAKSKVALSLSHMGDGAAEDFEQRLGATKMEWHACYDIETIGRRYQALADIACAKAGFESYADDAWHEVESARKTVGDRPIAIDSTASFCPFTLALALLKYGFSVQRLFVLHSKESDSASEHRLASQYPQLTVVKGSAASAITGAESIAGSSEYLSIGSDAAFLLEGSKPIALYHDEGCFGYQGVKWLMRALSKAAQKPEVEEADV